MLASAAKNWIRFGILKSVAGLGLVWVVYIWLLLPGRFFSLPFYRVGEIVFSLTSVDWEGSLKLLFSSHVRERDKALLRAILVGGVWNGFLLGRMRGEVGAL